MTDDPASGPGILSRGTTAAAAPPPPVPPWYSSNISKPALPPGGSSEAHGMLAVATSATANATASAIATVHRVSVAEAVAGGPGPLPPLGDRNHQPHLTSSAKDVLPQFSRPIHGIIVRVKQCRGQGFCGLGRPGGAGRAAPTAPTGLEESRCVKQCRCQGFGWVWRQQGLGF